jgi:hypothetical protein
VDKALTDEPARVGSGLRILNRGRIRAVALVHSSHLMPGNKRVTGAGGFAMVGLGAGRLAAAGLARSEDGNEHGP